MDSFSTLIRTASREQHTAAETSAFMGDLLGGRVIRDTAERTWGFARKGDGVRFYVFEGIANPAAFKRGYRRLLDAIPVDDLERQRVVAECRAAFALNAAVFRALGEEFPLSA
ncbi:biliverdin-producing heme oxygenase [Streptomyces sp. NRRL S-31]|uniref:biliverdin-producing heme oxygenase n=1 Tax=Streptomyces sp. NRRL S-31 TaxID=1463898 RepID=UPI0004C56E05